MNWLFLKIWAFWFVMLCLILLAASGILALVVLAPKWGLAAAVLIILLCVSWLLAQEWKSRR